MKDEQKLPINYAAAAAAAAKSLQSCLTLCNPIDSSPVPGILQVKTLEWVQTELQISETELLHEGGTPARAQNWALV